MQLTDIAVEVRDRDLKRLGLIRPEELRMGASILFNNVGSWSVNLPAQHPLASALRRPGAGIICYGPNDTLFSGPAIAPTFTANKSDPFGTVTVEGVTDEIALADALSFPDPTNPDPTTQTLAHDIRSGPAESVIYGFVNANIGPGAPATRRKAKLIMGANKGRGSTIKKSARFPVLGSLIQEIALADSLGFRVVQRGDNLVFEVYEVQDRSKVIRLDIMNNTLAAQTLAVKPPDVTQVIVAGQGELTERAFYAASNADALQAELDWGRRIERFVDQRQTDDFNEYVTKANEVLAAGGFTQLGVKLEPMDDSTMRFGTDWNLGDKVSAVTDIGEYPGITTGFVLAADADGFKVGAILGDPTSTDGTGSTEQLVKTTAKRLDQLERNAEVSKNNDAWAMQLMGVY